MVWLGAGLVLGQGATTNAPPTTKDLAQSPNTQLTPEGVDALMQKLYATISGPAGQKRDPDMFRSMFVKDLGRLSVLVKDRQTGQPGVRLITLDDYIQRSFPMLEKDGFYEQEVARRTERFGDLVAVWSTYESRRKPEDATPFMRGLNSIQIVNEGGQWKVLSIVWQAERPDLKLPEQYEKRR
ncbi:MAG: hypothetical protein NVS9B15_25000 [Acidobacteriaceae bacterium]